MERTKSGCRVCIFLDSLLTAAACRTLIFIKHISGGKMISRESIPFVLVLVLWLGQVARSFGLGIAVEVLLRTIAVLTIVAVGLELLIFFARYGRGSDD